MNQTSPHYTTSSLAVNNRTIPSETKRTLGIPSSTAQRAEYREMQKELMTGARANPHSIHTNYANIPTPDVAAPRAQLQSDPSELTRKAD